MLVVCRGIGASTVATPRRHVDTALRLDDTPTTLHGVRPVRCDYWDGYYGI